MKVIAALFVGFLCIGIFFRDFNNKARLCVFLVAAVAVIYVTLK